MALACLASIWGAGAGAAENYYDLSLAELGQMEISIATGNSTPIDKAPASASVVSAEDIAAMGAKTLDDILETLPGVHVALSSLSRLDSVYSIRGVHTGFNSQVLLLVNGIPVQYSLQGGRPTQLRMLAINIERVEVIRGPGSAIYGADAYAGVINVITKDAAKLEQARVGLGGGAFATRDFWAQGATRWRDLSLSFELAYRETEGDNGRKVSSDLQSMLDSVLASHASLAPGALATRYRLLDSRFAVSSERTQVNFWSWISDDAGVGAGGAQALDPVGYDDSKLYLADLTHHLQSQSPFWEHSIQMSYLKYDIDTVFQLFPPGAQLPIGSDGNLNFVDPAGLVVFKDGLYGNPGGTTRDARLEWVSLYTGWEQHQLRAALGMRRQSLDPREYKNFGPGVIDGTQPEVLGDVTDVSGSSFAYMDTRSRRLRYISLQDEWAFADDWSLTAGVRYDDYSDFDSTINPRLALVWSVNDKLTTKMLYGSAFRAPSFAELYFKNNPVSLGNSQLKPEQIDTSELSLNYLFTPQLQTNLTAFYYRATDMIDFIADPTGTTKSAQNILDQKGRGLELELNWRPDTNWRINTSYSWQDAQNIETDAPIADAPQHQIKLNANWEFMPHWHLNSLVNWVGERARPQGDSRPPIADYTWVNFTLRRQELLNNLDISLTLRNAANVDAREPSSSSIPDDYPLESRSLWLGVNYLFR